MSWIELHPFRRRRPEIVGDRVLRIGPPDRAWLTVWSCPLHRWHAMGRLPFGDYR